MGRQEERKERTRQRLLAAATKVFVKRGYNGATVEAVASAAGYTKGAVYAHFGNKENLFFEVFSLRAQEQLEQFEQRPSSGSQLDNKRWTILVLEFVLYAVRKPRAMRRLRVFFKENREMIARSLVPSLSGGELTSLGQELQILDLGYSVLNLVDEELDVATYTKLMRSMLARRFDT